MKQIKIVTRIDRTPVTSLQGMYRKSKTSVCLPQNINWQPIDIKPHAQLSINNKQENGVTIWTAKLVFRTSGGQGERVRWAYRCRLSNGQYRLIGSDARPYPVTSVFENMPESVTGDQLSEVTVTWQSDSFIPSIHTT